jgi:hypothetical protein
VRLGDWLAGELAFADVEAFAQVRILLQRLAPALVGQGQGERQVTLLSAKVEVRATAPGMLATQ